MVVRLPYIYYISLRHSIWKQLSSKRSMRRETLMRSFATTSGSQMTHGGGTWTATERAARAHFFHSWLLGTGATLVVTGALLVVTNSY